MITLILFKKNIEEEPLILNLPEEDWEFSIRLGTVGYNDNLLTVSNVNKHLNDSQNILNFFLTLRDMPKETIEKVVLKVDSVEMFDSTNLNFYYNNIFIQYIYTMSQATINRGNYGLSLFIGFTTVNPETGEVENIILNNNSNNTNNQNIIEENNISEEEEV